ncbi:hypothetical protein Tco_0315000, partial [Tanacetum coccineum]
TSSFHGDFQALLRRLDRQDLFQLYSLVQERYKHRSIKGHDLDLWGDLKMMFDPNEEDDICTNDGNTANVHVSTGSSPVSIASTKNSTACLSDATVYAYLATQPNGS